jgi:hypothetical protein
MTSNESEFPNSRPKKSPTLPTWHGDFSELARVSDLVSIPKVILQILLLNPHIVFRIGGGWCPNGASISAGITHMSDYQVNISGNFHVIWAQRQHSKSLKPTIIVEYLTISNVLNYCIEILYSLCSCVKLFRYYSWTFLKVICVENQF